MDLPPDDATIEVLALRRLGRAVDERFVEWACAMLVAGQDTPGLRVLAGELAPFNPFEMGALVDRVFRELGIVPFASAEKAAMELTTVRARQVLGGSRTRAAALEELANLYHELGFPRSLTDFYLLHVASVDLRQDGVQWYWPDANRDTIGPIVEERFRAWIDEHSPRA